MVPTTPPRRGLVPHLRAFTLVEVLIVVVILGILAALAIPALQEAVEKARVVRAIGEVKAIGRDLQEYRFEHGVYPTSLSAVEQGGLVDPWGNAYQYLKLEGTKGKGQARKDRFLVPINSDFDLYSLGADGATAPALTSGPAQDDIVWANDGGFVGLGSQY